MGNAKLNSWMQWILLVGVILTLAFAYSAYDKANSIEIPTIPSAQEVADLIVIPVVPTAEEIANAIETPDTWYSVKDYKKSLAEELATDELSDRDFKDDLADYISSGCDGTEDIDRHDITKISVRDVDVDVNFGGDALVTLELKVYYDNFGDSDETESSRVEVTFDISNLDRDDDYEDAEVDGYTITELLSCATD